MESQIKSSSDRFLCPHCNGSTKLPEPIPSTGKFRVSCALCQEKSLIRFFDSGYQIEEVVPSQKMETPARSASFPKKANFPNSHSQPKYFNSPSKDNQERNREVPLWEKKKIPIEKNNFLSLKDRIKKSQGQARWWKDLVYWLETHLPKYSNPFKTKYFQRDNNSSSSFPKYSQNLPWLKFLYWTGLGTFILAVVMFAILGTGILQLKSEMDDILASLSKGKPTKILDRNGQVVSEIFQKRTSTLKLNDYPENLKIALLNVEDRNFYSHSGIDFYALGRAIFQNIIHLRYKQGASTITQQLARILLDDRSKTISRKWRELELALALEAYISKDEILEYYMNNVYLGHGAFGFGEGIKFYFNENPSELKRSEAILLATLPSAPNRNSPLKNPKGSKIRLEYIIEAFKNRGLVQDIKEDEISNIYSKFSIRSPNETVFGNRQDLAPYVTEHVREVLKRIHGSNEIYDSGGYIVETTIIKGVQEELEKIVHKHLMNVQKRGTVRKTILRKSNATASKETLAIRKLMSESYLTMELFSSSELNTTQTEVNTGLQAAVVALNPQTGEILFMHGGDEFKSDNQFNRVNQMRRQTGSSIKPILYASAINEGKISTAEKIMDAPLIFRGVQGMPNWMPDNLGKSYDGEISVRFALTKSKNTAAVQVAEKLGFSNLDHYFSQFFFPDSREKNKRFRNDLSLALGTLEISPLEMASAFSAFGNEGRIVRPYLIRKITDPSGKVIYTNEKKDEFDLKVDEERKVLKPDTSEVILSLLKDSGRASGVYASSYKGILAGKTGTTQDYKDSWFVGLRPGIAMAVWAGFDNPRYGMGSSGLGGTVAAPLWGEIMAFGDKGRHLKSESFPKPIYAVPAKVCLPIKTNCTDCPPGQEWFTQDNVVRDSCSSFAEPSSENREVLQELF
ncbi:MAG: carboxypeptidase [Leptospira sp.]|nr:carboxypeptidase [Leptospira sp.]NCS95564.1 carboxypeptidase [Leptospira sp.]